MQGTPSSTGIGGMLSDLNSRYGLPDGYLTRTAGIESNFNPKAVNKSSGAAGPYQFVPSTAKAYGLSDPFDWAQSANAAAQLASNNAQVLSKALGRAPTGGELYLAHQQGAGGASALLTNPNAPAASIVGMQAVLQNGGTADMTAGQFAAKWTSKFPDSGSGASQMAGVGTIGNGAPLNPQTSVGSASPSQSVLGSSSYGTTLGMGLRAYAQAQQAQGQQPGDNGSGSPMLAGNAPAATAFDGTPLQNRGAASGFPIQDPSPAQASNSTMGQFPTVAQSAPSLPPPNTLGMASTAAGAQQPVDADGSALNPDGTPTALSFAGGSSVAAAPASRAIAAAAPVGGAPQPYGSVPVNIGGRMMTRAQAEADTTLDIDGTDYDKAAAAQGMAPGVGAAAVPASTPTGQPGLSPALPAAPPASSTAMPVSARTTGVPADAIRALLSNPNTKDVGLRLWEQSISGKNYGFMKDDNTGDIIATDPATGRAVVVHQGTPKPVTLSAGAALINPTSGAIIASQPASGNDASKKVVQIGEDQFGNKRFGVFDTSTGQTAPLNQDGTVPAPGTAPAPAAGGSGAVPPGSSGVMALHGDDFLSTLDPGTANQVKAIVEGRAPYPTGMMLKTAYGQRMAQYVTQTDPTFESGNAANRNKVRADFETGGPNSVAGSITAANTAIGHLGELSDAAQSLGNTWSPTWNRLGNATNQFFGGGIPVTQFNNIVGRLAEEMTKFYRGTGGTESDVQRDLANLNPNMSPDQLNAAIQKQATLMQDKVSALQARWHQGMGPLVADFPIIQPKTAQTLGTINQRAGIAPQGAQPPQPQAQAQGARVQVRSASDYQALPSGTRYLDPNGTPRIKP